MSFRPTRMAALCQKRPDRAELCDVLAHSFYYSGRPESKTGAYMTARDAPEVDDRNDVLGD